MITYTLPDGSTKRRGQSVILPDVQYGPDWLGLATPEELAAHGITVSDIPDPPPPPPPPAGAFQFRGATFGRPDFPRLSIVVGMANVAISHGAQGGDYEWLKVGEQFAWPDINGTPYPMDAQTLLEFAATSYSAS